MTFTSDLLSAGTLPVFIADNHAESFGWITRTFDIDQLYTLALIDAHSDASAAERSEDMREQLRRVPHLQERAKRIEAWRNEHRLQAFNWIEPLMPRPLNRVHWFVPEKTIEQARYTEEATSYLDGRLEVEPRSSGSFSGRWQTDVLESFQTWQPSHEKIILAIDLDAFAKMNAQDSEEAFLRIWKRAMELHGLKGIAFSISRPWLADSAQADHLVGLVLRVVRQTRNAQLEIDASFDDYPDDSLNAIALEKARHAIPRWDLEMATSRVKTGIRLLGRRVVIHDRKRSWDVSEFPAPGVIIPSHGEIDLDDVWRYSEGNEPVLRLEPHEKATGKVRWHVLRPSSSAYDLIPETGLGKGFSENAPRYIYEIPVSLGESQDFLLSPSTWRNQQGGTFRICAEYETSNGWFPAAPIDIRIRTGEGFRGSLSECMQMPYVFGIAGVSTDDLSGVETGWGSDCANLLIYAWRREGIPLTWGDPGRLRRQLVNKYKNVTLDTDLAISEEDVKRGLAIDFGKHMAAVWLDLPPLGYLGEEDLVMHHLGGVPEIIPLGQLTKNRPSFSVFSPPSLRGCQMAFAGDIVLTDENPWIIDHFNDHGASFFFANLEGIPSQLKPEKSPRFDFRFPKERLTFLKEHGVTAISLANNHAMDAGESGLLDGMEALREYGIPFVGAGANENGACQPWTTTHNGRKYALFGVSIVGDKAASSRSPGIARLPQHQRLLEEHLRQAKQRGEQIIILLHGGDEYVTRVNEDQRRWSRWLIARGASVISGSHPHVIQRQEIHGGATVMHSLGNAVYPSRLKGADSGKIQILEIPFSRP